MIGTKHLIQCHCVLPQFRKLEDPIFHKFVVYSKFLDDSSVEERLVKCNNCDAIHKVIDLCRSEIVLKIDDVDSILDENEIKLGLPDKIVKILEKNSSDIATYESIDHIIEKSAWGSEVIVSRKTINNEKIHVKILEIKGADSFRLKSETIDVLTEV